MAEARWRCLECGWSGLESDLIVHVAYDADGERDDEIYCPVCEEREVCLASALPSAGGSEEL